MTGQNKTKERPIPLKAKSRKLSVQKVRPKHGSRVRNASVSRRVISLRSKVGATSDAVPNLAIVEPTDTRFLENLRKERSVLSSSSKIAPSNDAKPVPLTMKARQIFDRLFGVIDAPRRNT